MMSGLSRSAMVLLVASFFPFQTAYYLNGSLLGYFGRLTR